ncbi:ferric reduction oxidase 2-like isoform X1 [Gastrolobium bilobum]|uniref:ferric reduction oxidase 2-like isoform X1 n=1 Tax=Gastrolobium bilobum TaxID=150636 RepID=UPI002AAF866A|nr:ferric reduction oxidase 2-like isoform X1 [Gastrolobium bilobum]
MPEGIVKRSPSQEKNGSVQSVIRLLVVLLLLGWIFIWIMMPTNTYRQRWMLQLQAKSSFTYFGAQGVTLLISTFPALFIAALGCVYLHIAKKTNGYNMESRNDQKRKVTMWKRPVLVKGPFGIVSSTELAFLLMFIALLVWTFATVLHNHFPTITQKSAAAIGEKVWQMKLEAAALGLGVMGNVCLAFLFFPVARGSSVLPLLGLASESCIKYHIWLGNMVMTLYTFHGFGYIIYWAVTNQISQMLKWSKVGISNVAGEIALFFGLFSWVATIPCIRRKAFELFFYTHHLYILFIVFYIFHIGISDACAMLPSFYLFLVDRYLRFLQSRRQVRLVSARVLPCHTVELNFSKGHGLTYNPTSVMFINIPSISKLQWHPFTVVSNSNLEQEMLSVVIKSEGTWTQKLYQLLSTPSLIDNLDVSVEGPYGPASSNYLRHDTLVMVSGGSGITPFISIIRELIYLSTTFKCTTPKVVLICVFKNSSCLSMLDLILPISGSPFDISSLQLQIEAYITRDKELKRDNPINLQTIRFKPNPTDAPIYAVLGPNSWLWLGAIISSSFIIFLIIIGIINRYYIFPIDHNSNQIFSFPLRSFLDMLAICVSIVIVASAAVLWNKKQNAKDANQIQNLEGSPPAVSPSMIYNNADRELESLPYQSLVQATNVHFGARPDLRRLLLEFKGPSVGVLVSGPKKMRQEVAAVCSSGLAENLHFESISFSW